MNPDGFAALAALLGPSLSVDRFLGEYWDMWSVHIPPHDGERPPPHGRAFGGVLALEDMDDLLIRVQLPSSKAELLLFEDLREATGSYATPHAAFASGASIIVNHADKVWPRINELPAAPARRPSGTHSATCTSRRTQARRRRRTRTTVTC